MSPSRWYFLVACALFASGCDPGEHAVLIDVYTQDDLDNLSVTVISLDSPNAWNEPPESVNRTADDINADPLRVAVRLPRADTVLVQITATGIDPDLGGPMPAPRLIAIRCYSVNGIVRDEVELVIFNADDDGDGFVADPDATCLEPAVDGLEEHACDPTVDFVCPADRAADCDETNVNIHPGAGIICLNGIDEDCDGDVDEECADLDNDGFSACPEMPTAPCDCNDNVAAINPDATDICADGINQDCSNEDACCDNDGDNAVVCSAGVTDPRPRDCDDDDATSFPGGIEVCDGADNNCMNGPDEPDECRGGDFDRDGHVSCTVDPSAGCDCVDCDAAVHVGAREVCGNMVDEDCDTMLDNGCGAVDVDGDGYGPNDCDDTDPLTFPHLGQEVLVERCMDDHASTCVPGAPDGVCDATNDPDMDGFIEPPECNIAAINPDVMEICDGLDNDCDGITDEVLQPTIGCGQTSVGGTPVGIPVDYSNSLNDCGGCRLACNQPMAPPVANQCVGSTCMCIGTETSTPSCAGGNDRCCTTGCANVQTDGRHCGGCESPCPSGETCGSGTCHCGAGGTCGAGDTCCGGQCVNLRTHPENCGACGRICGSSNTFCNDGNCACTSAGGNWQDCNGNLGAGGDGCETDIATNADFCGSCSASDRACSPNNGARSCSGGNCDISCSTGFRNCDGDARGNGCEINITNDPDNCGSCGGGCSGNNGTRSCSGNNCSIACNGGFDNCDSDARTNGCETQLNSVANCGACGRGCSVSGGTANCSTGTCRAQPCNTGLANCDPDVTTCERNIRTVTDCGGCNVACTFTNGTGDCSTGTCNLASCNVNFQDCGTDGDCDSLLTTSNCTACGVQCTFANGTGDCSTGACRLASCNATYQDCGSDNDCDSLRTLSDCGTCGTPCSITNATATCASGLCRVSSCTGAFADCNGDGVSCETDTSTSTAHCGGCNRACASGAMCIGGTCHCGSMSGDLCTARMGDSCSGSNCRCNGGAACGSTQTCTGTGCT